MAKNSDPKFVRLASRLTRGCCADVNGSGWSIAGLDVKPFPETNNARGKAQAKFVRKMLGQGYLEPASRAEYEDILEARASLPLGDALKQESRFQRAAEEATERIVASRNRATAADPVEEDEDEDDDESEEEDEIGHEGEDDEEEEESKPAPAKKSAKKGNKKKGK